MMKSPNNNLHLIIS